MFDDLLRKLWPYADDSSHVHGWPTRWIVLDTETTGLSLWRDHLLSIAAVAVHCESGFRHARIQIADRFEVVLHQEKPTHHKKNILIHHIGVQAQHDGQDPLAALQRFTTWVGGAPIFAFHAPFDRAMVLKACKQVGLENTMPVWLDVAALARAVRQDSVSASLDDRLSEFGLECFARHHASADTFATAELLLHMLPALREKVTDFEGLQRLCADHRLQNMA